MEQKKGDSYKMNINVFEVFQGVTMKVHKL